MPATQSSNAANRALRDLDVEIRGLPVRTPYTDQEAIVLLEQVDSPFARDLIRRHQRGVLSQSQMAWVHYLVNQQEVECNRPLVEFRRIAEIFRRAAGRLQHPRVAITVGSVRLTLSVGGSRSRHPGAINITDGRRYPDNTFYGRIHTDGRWEPSQRSATPEIVAALEAINLDPAAAAGMSGRNTGHCCFCGLTLTDERSISVGYGPICAIHYGLSWGGRSAESVADRSPGRTPRATQTAREIRTVACPRCGENMDEGGVCGAC